MLLHTYLYTAYMKKFQIEEYKNTSTEHLQTINRLQNDLELVERTLDSVNLDNSNLENSKSELEM